MAAALIIYIKVVLAPTDSAQHCPPFSTAARHHLTLFKEEGQQG